MKWFVEIRQIYDHNSFGEHCLISENQRTVTVKCLTDCYFATLTRKNYQKVLLRINNREIDEKIDFFRQLPFLTHWTDEKIVKFMM